MNTVLVVDDDATVRDVVVQYLQQAGFDTLEAADGLEALEIAASHPLDLVILDLMLPGIDGLEVFRRLRADFGRTPVVMLTARGDESDRILGLEAGADDYVSKPFSPRELVLRVRSVLRRADNVETATDSTFTDGDLSVDTSSRRVTVADADIALTTREFDLLVHLISHPDVAFSRDQLMQHVWGWEFGDETTVTVHIRRLREKIEPDPANPTRIVTVWGVGYRWDGVDSAKHDQQQSTTGQR